MSTVPSTSIASAPTGAPAESSALDRIVKLWPIAAFLVSMSLMAAGGYAVQDSRNAASDARLAVKAPLFDATRADVEVLKDRAARTETALGDLKEQVNRNDATTNAKLDILLGRSAH